MDEEGTITDGGELSVATYYSPCIGIMNADGYLRVVCDAPGHYTETRVDHATLINAGWTPPQASPENDEAWHPLPGASLRFMLRFVATLRLRLGAGSGLPSAGLFCFFWNYPISPAEK